MGKKPLIWKWLAVGIILLLIGTYIFPATAQETEKSQQASRGNWLYVGGSGPGNYTKIQDAINNSSDGDTVFVFNGTYVGHLNINKSITLLGEDKNATVILGYVAFTISFLSDWVTMGRFTIQNSGRLGEGIRIDSSHNTFFDTIIEFPNDNIRIAGDYNTIEANIISCDTIYLGGNSNTITGNNITNVVHGIYLADAGGNIISHNTFLSCGLFLSDNSPSNTLVTNNTVNGKPLVYVSNKSDMILPADAGQIILLECINITVQNHVIFNTTVGIQLLRSTTCVVSGNIIGDSLYGVWLNGWNNTLHGNTIKDNEYGIRFTDSVGNHIYHNNLLRNTLNAYDPLSNTWDNSSRHEGNYWSDYTGGDTDGDGIGDTPYNISGGSNQDLYPLMHPFELYYIFNISLDNPQVNEGNTFNVTVKTLGGTAVQNAGVLFDNTTTYTDDNGIAVITAPSVAEDTIYPVVATKPGHISDNDTILVKNIEPFKAIFVGLISDLNDRGGEVISFKAKFVFFVRFDAFEMGRVIPDEEIWVSRDYKGYLGPMFILGIFTVVATEFP
ncbi:MAG: NosD domain-containing protein [Candidatus Thermoplasmatota archaeon]